jgi:TonB family protein
MSNSSALDRESFQRLLESAFVVQQGRMDPKSHSAIVEIERLIMRGELDEVHKAMHLVDGTRKVANISEAGTSRLIDDQAPSPLLGEGDQKSLEQPIPPDTLDGSLASFRVGLPREKTSQFRFRNPWTLFLLVLVSSLALLLGWMLGRVTWPGVAHTKEPPAVGSVSQEAKNLSAPAQVTAIPRTVPVQSAERQAQTNPPPPVHSKEKSLEASSGSLIVYQDGKVIYELNASEDATPSGPESVGTISSPSQAPGEPSTSYSAEGFPGKEKLQLLHLVQPEYPETARQQHMQGPVVLEGKVGKDGEVQQLSVISGDSMLATAASNAVRQWRFKPLVRNGHVVQFETRIKINFALP